MKLMSDRLLPHVLLIVAIVVGTIVLHACQPTSLRESDPRVDVQRNPTIWKVLGKSVEDRPIHYAEYGSGSETVLVIGCTHGDEQVGGQVVVKLAEHLARQAPDSIRAKVVLVPVLNPDGVERHQRMNARDVDINRNFPTRNWSPVAAQERYNPGPVPASEPETKLVMKLIETYSPEVIISIHSPLHMVNYDGPAQEIAERMGKLNGYRVDASIGYPTPGSLGTYAGVERNIPIITLELPPGEIDEAWEQNREALLDLVASEQGR